MCAAPSLHGRCATAISALTLLVYPRTSSAIFSTFNCDTFDAGEDAHGDELPDLYRLHDDLSIDCYEDKHKAFQVYAFVMVVIYPVGVPLAIALVLFCVARRPFADIAAKVREDTALAIAASVRKETAASVRADTALQALGQKEARTVDLLEKSIRKELPKAYAWLKPITDGYKPKFLSLIHI